jgi:hypothetical protein
MEFAGAVLRGPNPPSASTVVPSLRGRGKPSQRVAVRDYSGGLTEQSQAQPETEGWRQLRSAPSSGRNVVKGLRGKPSQSRRATSAIRCVLRRAWQRERSISQGNSPSGGCWLDPPCACADRLGHLRPRPLSPGGVPHISCRRLRPHRPPHSTVGSLQSEIGDVGFPT